MILRREINFNLKNAFYTFSESGIYSETLRLYIPCTCERAGYQMEEDLRFMDFSLNVSFNSDILQ